MKQIFDDVTFGKVTIKNVPTKIDEYGEAYFVSSVSCRLSHLYEYMIENNMTEINYEEETK